MDIKYVDISYIPDRIDYLQYLINSILDKINRIHFASITYDKHFYIIRSNVLCYERVPFINAIEITLFNKIPRLIKLFYQQHNTILHIILKHAHNIMTSQECINSDSDTYAVDTLIGININDVTHLSLK